MSQVKVLRSAADVLALLETDGVPHGPGATGADVQIPTRLGREEALLTLRWAAPDRMLHLFQDMNTVVPTARIAAMDEAIARLNHAMPVAGFGLNPRSSRLYYRLTVPLRGDGYMSAPELRLLFTAAVKNAADFLETLRRVADEDLAPSEVVVQAAAYITARDPSAPTA